MTASPATIAPTVSLNFKQSEVGLIPADWKISTLREVISDAQLGGNYANTPIETDAPLIKMGNIGRGNISLGKLEFIPKNVPVHQRDRLRRGDVLFNTRNTLDLVGKVCIWNNELPEAYFNSNIMRFTFSTAVVSSQRFMNYALNSSRMISSLRGIATGTTSVAAIYGRDLFCLKLPLPTKEEQRRIAEALSDTDALIEALESLIVKKRQVKHGAMQILLFGKERLPGFCGEWKERHIGEVANIRNEKINTYEHPLASICIELEDIEQGSGRLIACSDARGRQAIKYKFEVGDVLFGRLRPYLRKFWRADRVGVCSTEIWPITPSGPELDAGFLSHIVQTDAFVEAASAAYGTHMPRADWRSLSDLSLILPPTIEEQSAIADILSTMDEEIDALENKLLKARSIRQGMMQELLTGRVRLL